MALVLALAVGVTVAACSSTSPAATGTPTTTLATSPPPATDPVPAPVAPSTPVVSSPAPTSVVAAPPAGTTTPPEPPSIRCHTSQLQGAYRSSVGAGGHGRFDVVVTNTSRQPCSIDGYPGLGFLSSDRHPLTSPVTRGSSMLTLDRGPVSLLLQPGQTASASVGYTFGCPGVQPAYVEITPPDERGFLLAPVAAPPGTHLLLCQVTVTAFVAGARGSSV